MIALLIAFSSLLMQSSGLERTSTLQRREKKPLPPQMVDYTPYDDVIVLHCEEQPDYIRFDGVQLKPVVRVRVNVRVNTKENRWAPEQKYENLWFKDGTPIGSKRFTALPIRERHEVGIFLKDGSDLLSDAEIAACAGALVRLRLEANLNKNQILTVRIPSTIYERLKLELQKRNFFSYRENSLSIRTLIPIPLESEFGKREVMSFMPRN
jgi:hypothetical protein